MIASGIVIRHVLYYDDFAALTIAAGSPAPPLFPLWQRIGLGSLSALGFIGAWGMLFKRSWGVYLFMIAFIVGQTFAFSIGQWGLPSFLTGFAVVLLGMNYLHEMK
jgi:hypothetical protein